MRFAAPALAALALTAGCVRFGYESHSRELDSGVDSGLVGPDGAVSGAGSAAVGGMVAAGRAGMVAAGSGGEGGAEAGTGAPAGAGGAGSGAMDAGVMRDAAMSDSGGADSGAIDAGAQDSGLLDAGAPDSSAKDSGSTDPVDPSWTEDCPGLPSVLFCDDFEDGLGKWDYQVHMRGSTGVSTDYKRAGGYSLRASTSASTSNSQSQARQGVKVFGHRKSGDLWARYFYYLPSSVTLTQKLSTGVISELEEPYFGFSVLIFPDGIGVENGGVSRRVNTPFPRNQWVCVEMHVQIHATDGAFEVYMNGSKVTSILGDTLPDQGYTSFEAGVHYADFNQGAINAYTDDVRLGTARIGCN